MYNIIRFYNQNRKKIIRIVLIIVLIIGGIQLFNYFAKQSNKAKYGQKNTIDNNVNTTIDSTKENQELISNKSLISGQTVDSDKLKKDTEIIKEFVDYCNKKDFSSAYNLLTEECKEVMFPSIQDFYNIYYLNIFANETRLYTIQNWAGSTYQIRYTEDILSSGNLNGTETKQDYITVIKNNDEKKLNINSYVGRSKSNKETNYKDIKVNITSIDTYMDYQIYNLDVQNNTEKTILLDTSDDVNSVYLLDSKNMKYQFYNNEIIQNRLIVKSEFTNNIQIKFNNSYSSNRRIEKIVFSKLILNYDEYLQLEDKNLYKDFCEFRVNV